MRVVVRRLQVPQLLRASGPEAAHFLAAHVAAVSELPVAGAPAGQRQAAAAAALGGLRPGAACPLALQPVASEVGQRPAVVGIACSTASGRVGWLQLGACS